MEEPHRGQRLLAEPEGASSPSTPTHLSDLDSSAEGEDGSPSPAEQLRAREAAEAVGYGDLLFAEPPSDTKKSLMQGRSHLGMEDDEGYIEYKWKLVGVSKERLDNLITQMKFRVAEGQGECMYEIGVDNDGHPKGLNPEDYRESVRTIRKMAESLNCDCGVVCEKLVAKAPEVLKCCELMIRKIARAGTCLDLRIAICGNYDSGKSTLTGVITTGELDDGRGSVRQAVFKHRHEVDTGRTSSISTHMLGFDSAGRVVNYRPDGMGQTLTDQEIAEQAAKVITLFDLAGHERYLKTTVFGMTGCIPDYGALVIAANNGVQRMTKEHLNLCLALKMPVFGVVTRIDMTPEATLKANVADFEKLLRSTNSRKVPCMVRNEEDVVQCAKCMKENRIAPIFCVSNVTGQGFDLLRKFINLLPPKDWSSVTRKPAECPIENTYFVSGVGTVVSGTVTQGVVHASDSILLGPDAHGQFRNVRIKGIHLRGLPVKRVEAGQTASFALKEKREHIRKGMLLVGKDAKPQCCWEFEADVVLLFQSPGASSCYQFVVHCRTVRQAAKLELLDRDHVRTGDKASVRFRFLYRPEYLVRGSQIIFREGATKGLGTVTKVSAVAPVVGGRK
ncbi:GTP-binding protein cgp-1 [Diplonema papillatum]|nr:GTP-binding protein cgp-1 [Diplonema papillatum]